MTIKGELLYFDRRTISPQTPFKLPFLTIVSTEIEKLGGTGG